MPPGVGRPYRRAVRVPPSPVEGNAGCATVVGELRERRGKLGKKGRFALVAELVRGALNRRAADAEGRLQILAANVVPRQPGDP